MKCGTTCGNIALKSSSPQAYSETISLRKLSPPQQPNDSCKLFVCIQLLDATSSLRPFVLGVVLSSSSWILSICWIRRISLLARMMEMTLGQGTDQETWAWSLSIGECFRTCAYRTAISMNGRLYQLLSALCSSTKTLMREFKTMRYRTAFLTSDI